MEFEIFYILPDRLVEFFRDTPVVNFQQKADYFRVRHSRGVQAWWVRKTVEKYWLD